MGAILQIEWKNPEHRGLLNVSIKSENFQGIYLDDENGNRVLCRDFDELYKAIGFWEKTIEFRLSHKSLIGQPVLRPEPLKESHEKVKEDPWKHRSCGMKCRTCMWYVPKVVSTRPAFGSPAITNITVTADEDGNILPKNKKGIGRCRRHAPTMNGYPVCFQDDFCGDHKLDENKV